jgi:AraC-like DNA-binding protein
MRQNDVVGYREALPPPDLRTHVACVWTRSGECGPVLPDGCVDIVWTGRGLVVAGPSTRAFLPRTAVGAAKVGIRFRVGAADSALGIAASELRNDSPRLADVWREGSELEERCAQALSIRERLQVLTQAVSERVGDARLPDQAVLRAVDQLRHPGTRVSAVESALSSRQLRRRFDVAIGYSPKTLAGVLRLQRFLWLSGRSARDLAALATAAGFADQSHLTRECTRLAGQPPKVLLDNGAAAAGEPAVRTGLSLRRH